MDNSSPKIPDCPPELLPEYAKLGRIERTTQAKEYMPMGPAGGIVLKLQKLVQEKHLELGARGVLIAELKEKIKLLESGEALVLKTEELERVRTTANAEIERLTKDVNEGKLEIAQLKRKIDDILPREPTLGDTVGVRRPRTPR